MFVYLIMLLICVIMGWIFDKVKINTRIEKIIIIGIAFLTLFLVSGLRYNVGMDYNNTYVYTYNRIKNGAESVRIDSGFYLLNKIIIFFGGSSQWVFLITSYIINYYICKAIIQQSENKALSMYIYITGTLFFFSLNGIRQAIVMSIFYYSLKFLKEKNLKKFIIYNTVAVLFHNSALLFIPLGFVLNKEFPLRIKVFSLIILILLIPFITNVLSIILLNTKYSMYLTNGYYNPLKALNVSSIINILLFILYETQIKKKDDIDIIYSNIHFVGIVVTLFFTQIPLVIRVFMSFRYIEFLSVPNLMNKVNVKKGTRQLAYILIVLLYFIYFINGVYIKNGNTVLPYQSIFTK